MIKPPNCSPSLWKRFPSLSRHLGSKAIEDDRGYGHYTIFRPRGRRSAAEQRDELAAFQLIELHLVPLSQRGLQDIELARSSQRVIHACSRLDVDCAIARTAGYEGSSRTGPRDRIS